MRSHCVTSSRNLLSVWWFSVELYEQCRAFHNDSRMLQGYSLYMIVLMVDSDFFLIQFIRSYGCLFKIAISCILLSKNFLLAN